MQQIKLLRNLGMTFLAIFTFALSVFLAHPSQAINNQYQNMIALGLIDAVKTPQELGLDYLQQTPPILIADLMDNIHRAKNRVQSTSNIQVKIPLPSADNATVPTGYRAPAGNVLQSTSGHPGISSETHRYRAVGQVNRQGNTEPIRTRSDLAYMFIKEARGGGDINRGIRASKDLPKDQSSLIADASGLFAQEQEIYTIDLILDDTWDRQRYLVPDINLNAFCRDSLNAVLEDTWEPL